MHPCIIYTGYAGWAVTTRIPVKLGTAHGRSRPEVGSTKCIDVYGSGGVFRPSLIIGKYEQQIITPTDFLRLKHNFHSLTVCRLEQYIYHTAAKTRIAPHILQ